jgi:hypothetical protein
MHGRLLFDLGEFRHKEGRKGRRNGHQVVTQVLWKTVPLSARVRVCRGGCPGIRLGKHALQIVARQIEMWFFFNKPLSPRGPEYCICRRLMEL